MSKDTVVLRCRCTCKLPSAKGQLLEARKYYHVTYVSGNRKSGGVPASVLRTTEGRPRGDLDGLPSDSTCGKSTRGLSSGRAARATMAEAQAPAPVAQESRIAGVGHAYY